MTISFLEAAILLVSDGDRDLLPDGILSPQITDFRLHCAESRANPKLPKLPCCGLFQLPVVMPLFQQPIGIGLEIRLARGPDSSSA